VGPTSLDPDDYDASDVRIVDNLAEVLASRRGAIRGFGFFLVRFGISGDPGSEPMYEPVREGSS